MKDDIKIFLTSHCGTYSSWLAWTVASVYNIVDHVVILNGGYDTDHPETGHTHVLRRELEQLKAIDINHKIVQHKPNMENLRKTGLYTDGKDELARSGNMTLAYQYALATAEAAGYDLDKVWILKLDSDQIAHDDFSRELLIKLATNTRGFTGFRFGQFADYYRSFDRVQSLCHWCANEEGNMTNDGSLFFKAHNRARAGGQGSPDIGQEVPINAAHTFHMRRIHPPDVPEYDYHFKRFWYHCFGPNQIMELQENKDGRILSYDEISEIAHNQTKSMLQSRGKAVHEFVDDEGIPDPRFPIGKPSVVGMGTKIYIEQGFPK